MAKPPRDPFAVKLSAEKRKEICDWICDEVEAATYARSALIEPGGLLDYGHHLYEQGETPARHRRWENAADLASWLVTEKVDALRARVTKTIFAEPFSVVEGWGADAKKAPYVEEFHQWKRKDERLRAYLSKAVHNSLIEQNGILEVLDRAEYRKVRRAQQALAASAEDGSLLLGPKLEPSPAMDEAGKLVPATEDQPAVEVQFEELKAVRKGPGYRVHSQRDFLFLPGHAHDTSEIFGYAARVWMRVSAIHELAVRGEYDADVLEQLGTSSDREDLSPGLIRSGQDIAEQRDRTAEKELWRVLFLHDLDEDGLEEWYIATVSVRHRVMTRLRRDDLGHPRFIDLTPFPRPDSVYGYSFVLDKIATVTEEHTARRNMVADRSNLATNPPMKRVVGALWDPDEQPWGTGRVIDVRDMREVEPMQVPDVPASAMQLLSEPIQAAERLSGMNDNASGIRSDEKRTATEVQQVAIAGAVRVEEIVENIQDSLQVLDEVRHEIWKRTLAQAPDGVEAPEAVVRSLQTRELELEDGRFTASMLEGNFVFKPHGSVETADRNRQRGDWNGTLSALAGLAKMAPPIAAVLQHPAVIKSVLEQTLRLYNVPDKQPFLEALKAVEVQAQQAAEQQRMQAQQQAQIGPAGNPGGQPGNGADPEAILKMLPPEIQQQILGGGNGAVQ